MKYILEVRQMNSNTLEDEWAVYTRGTLEVCLADFFYLQCSPAYNQSALRLTWEQD